MVSVSPFLTNVDIGNRALQHLGARQIASFAEVSKAANEVAFCYDKLRVAELQRSTWRFATRRVNLRAVTATASYRFIPIVYSAATTYAAGVVVKDATGVYWISNVAGNLANTPGGATTAGYPAYWNQYFGPTVANLWDAAVTYDAGEVVYKTGSPRAYSISSTNTNLNHDPASGAPWVSLLTVTADQLVTFFQPAGPAKTVSTRARNMFALPNGFLRALAPDPKVESRSNLATSAALQYGDLQFEGNYIISSRSDPILLRFVADVSNVLEMSPLFCEGLAARVAYELCETLTQSPGKLQAVGAAYSKFIRDARLVNWLETASTEPQEEEYELTHGPQPVIVSATSAPQRGQ